MLVEVRDFGAWDGPFQNEKGRGVEMPEWTPDPFARENNQTIRVMQAFP